MRPASSVLACSILAAAACGGASKPATTGAVGNTAGAPDAPAPTAVGTTGLPGLDWGAPAAAVLALYPRGTASAEGVTVVGMVDGHQAISVYTIGASGLSQVEIEWTEGYVSMEDCAHGWEEGRAKVDARLGEGSAENLAAYWDTPTATVTLFCNPNENGAGVLGLTAAPRPTDE